MKDKIYLGIDLGTSNSAVAVFKEDLCEIVHNPFGHVSTPSVVRICENGVEVGEKAQRFLYKDSVNTFKEFKRLMGTDHTTTEDRNGTRWTPEQLSAEVLKKLKASAEEYCGMSMARVVITVPALFELPQSRATSEAARLAGFTQVELLPEPVASALASGWNQDQAGTSWLVYDLGGGTFDVSLLESRDGLLRVVAHDGDNYLGGKDIDRAIVDWLIETLSQEQGIQIATALDNYSAIRRQLEFSAEKAKIALSKVERTLIELAFDLSGEPIACDVSLSRQTLETLCAPLVQRSLDICHRLIRAQGLTSSHLSKVVLVGGPGHMPMIQAAIESQLAPIAEAQGDPMSLVAMGAACYAFSIDLACRGELPHSSATELVDAWWLQHPTVCSELNPAVMGRKMRQNDALVAVQLMATSSQWASTVIVLESDGTFFTEVLILPGQLNTFDLIGLNAKGEEIQRQAKAIKIVHGVSISDPPLSRSIGISLADGTVKTFIDRGTPLPAKRSFVQSTVDSLTPNSDQEIIIPIVQGERRKAQFCRKVGELVIKANRLDAALPMGSEIEITIQVDRGGDLKAQAFITSHNALIQGVAQLQFTSLDPNALKASCYSINSRVNALQKQAFRNRDENQIAILQTIMASLSSLFKQFELLDVDLDACQRLSKQLMDIEVQIEQIEGQDQLSVLADECENAYFNAMHMVQEYGDSIEKKLLEKYVQQYENAIKYNRQEELERLVEKFDQIFNAAHKRSPNFWRDIFSYWAAKHHMATDLKRARKIIEEGRRAINKNDRLALEALTMELYNLLPAKEKSVGDSYDSGVF